MPPTAYHQLGLFIVDFQHLEEKINDLLELISGGDGECVRILANDLEYAKRLNTADVLFARFVDVRINIASAEKVRFHELVVELGKLGQRRNDLVHSNYMRWEDIDQQEGLLRRNSKLRGKAGTRELSEEELKAEDFDKDLDRLRTAARSLEEFRLQVIDWLYPSDGALGSA